MLSMTPCTWTTSHLNMYMPYAHPGSPLRKKPHQVSPHVVCMWVVLMHEEAGREAQQGRGGGGGNPPPNINKKCPLWVLQATWEGMQEVGASSFREGGALLLKASGKSPKIRPRASQEASPALYMACAIKADPH